MKENYLVWSYNLDEEKKGGARFYLNFPATQKCSWWAIVSKIDVNRIQTGGGKVLNVCIAVKIYERPCEPHVSDTLALCWL